MVIRRLILPLCFLLAAGCAARETLPAPGSSPPPSPTTQSTTIPLDTPPSPMPSPTPGIRLRAEDLAGLEISFWHPWDGERGDRLEEMTSRFNAENTYGIIVKTTVQENHFQAVSQALQGSGSPLPDVAVGFNYHAAAWKESGTLVDLTPYLEDPVWGLPDSELQDFYPGFLAQAAPGGTQTGLPFYRTADILLYNQTWAQELGFSRAPDSPEALRTQACAANTSLRTDADVSNDQQGGIMLGFEPSALLTWMEAFGGGFSGPGEGSDNRADHDDNITAMTFLRSLLDENCAWTPDEVFPHADFAARRGLFLSSTLAGVPFQEAAMQEAGSSDEWTIIPYPGLAGQPVTIFSGPDFVLFSMDAESRLAAWVFARWMADPNNAIEWFRLTGYYPARASTFSNLSTSTITEADWIPSGTAFPADPTWPVVQWMVSDLARSLFAPLNSVNEVPLLLEELESLILEFAIGNSP